MKLQAGHLSCVVFRLWTGHAERFPDPAGNGRETAASLLSIVAEADRRGNRSSLTPCGKERGVESFFS